VRVRLVGCYHGWSGTENGKKAIDGKYNKFTFVIFSVYQYRDKYDDKDRKVITNRTAGRRWRWKAGETGRGKGHK
jgi:hypothetical protein